MGANTQELNMNKTLRNFWIDIILFLLLGTDTALVIFTRQTPAGAHPGLGWHFHALISILLSLVCVVHTLLHWRWFQAVLTGRAKGRVKLIMQSLVVVIMVLANISGHEVLASHTAGRLHSLTGTLALIGLCVHAVRHSRWMAGVAKRLIVDGGQKKVIQSA